MMRGKRLAACMCVGLFAVSALAQETHTTAKPDGPVTTASGEEAVQTLPPTTVRDVPQPRDVGGEGVNLGTPDCAWDNGIVPNGTNARAISPPGFPDIRVVDDIQSAGGCTVGTLQTNIIEDAGWTPGDVITVFAFEDTGSGPGAMIDSVDLSFTRTATGDQYFGRDDFNYLMEGVGISLPAGTSWIGTRNPNGGGAGTNYWMVSDGGVDGPGSDTGWFSLDAGATWQAEGDPWHHAFEILPPPGNGACCLPDGSCTDDVPSRECADSGGRFERDTLCADLDPPCEEQTGRCCIDGDNPECAVITATECGQRGGDFAGFGTDCIDDPCGFAEGACCLGTECLGTTRRAECDNRGGAWFEGETCPEFACPEVIDCLWDNGIVPNGANGRALSPPGFPDIRVVDDVNFNDPGCTIGTLNMNIIEDAGWTPGDTITVFAYEDTGGNGPGALIDSVDLSFVRTDTGDQYFGRADFLYSMEGVGLDLPGGVSWIGVRNPDGGGAGTNYWMTSDGGTDGPGSDTGWFSLDAGQTFQPEGDPWHHAFEIVPPPGNGACCLPDGSCTDDVPGRECRESGGRFARDTLCADLDPPCEEQTGRCCIDGDNPECAVITATECGQRGGEFAGFGTDCVDDPCGFAEGACCIFPDCLGTMRMQACEDLGGAWFEGETCPEFACPEVIDCLWDNGIITNGANGRALSPPGFPDIRVVDDVNFNDPGCTIGTLNMNIIEDAGWTPGDTITVFAYEDTGGNGPGALIDSVDLSFVREDTGDQYFGREDFVYSMEGVGLELPGGVSWIGVRNPDGGGAGTNYWMTSDGGLDGPGSDTGWFSLDAGQTFQAEGDPWHHAFEIIPPPGNGACCLPDGSCTDDVPGRECRDSGGSFSRDTLCDDLDPPCEEQTGRCCIEGGGGCTRDPMWICDGDTDGDGQVNPVDSGLVQAHFGSNDDQDLCNYDVDCDGQINPVDSGIVQSLFGTCNPPRDSCGTGGDPECAIITATECRARGGEFGGFGTDCEGDPCGFATGACCLELECLGTTREAECDDRGGIWFQGQTCPEFECPDVIGCAWDNGIISNGVNGRALSPPGFPDIRVVDDIIAERGGCTILNFHANVIEDAGWSEDGMIQVFVYDDSGNGPGALLAAVDTEFTKIDTGDDYFGRDDFEYWIEGVSIDLPEGTSWVGLRNPGGGGAGTNYWMTSDGGSDGPGSDTGWFSLDAGSTWQAEGDTWHHAFEIVP